MRLQLGHHGFWFLRPYRLLPEDVSFHKHVMGVTKQGKSKFLAGLCDQFFSQHIPFCLIDPHSDLADDLLAMLADRGLFQQPDFYQRLWYLDLSRLDRFVPFNVLSQNYPEHKVAEQLVEVCRRVWPALAEGQAPMFENIMRHSAKILIANKLPVTELPRLISNKAYRDQLLTNVQNIHVVEFFHDNFDRLNERDQFEQIQSTRRRVDLLTDAPQLLYSMGQLDNTLDFRGIMDYGVSLIVNLGGKDITPDTQKFLGAFLMHGFEEAAHSRAAPGSPRDPYHLLVDEFDRFSTHSEAAMTDMLSQTRKFGLYLTMAHQNWSQVSSRLQSALQNTIHVTFRLGRLDAEIMAKEMLSVDPHTLSHREEQDTEGVGMREQWEEFTQQLTELRPRQAFIKANRKAWPTLGPDGIHRHPHFKVSKIRTLKVPPTKTTPEQLAAIKERYARMLLRPKEEVAPFVDKPAPVQPDTTTKKRRPVTT